MSEHFFEMRLLKKASKCSIIHRTKPQTSRRDTVHFPKRLKNDLVLAKNYAIAFVYWLALGIIAGIFCGLLGAGFSKTISFATDFRNEHQWLIFLLPIGGLISVAIYRLCKVSGTGTNHVFESVRTEKPVPFLLAPAIFAGSALTHLCGGSAGKEGAALQLGGSVSTVIAKILHLNEKSRHILTMCGMGALFSAVFGTPLGACVFALEVISVGQICLAAIFPTFVSSITAYVIAIRLGVTPERFHIESVPGVNPDTFWRVIVIAIAVAIVSAAFCHLMHYSAKLFEKLCKNRFLRIFVGGIIIIGLTLLIGTSDYNGGGIEVIDRIFHEGTVRPEAFILKMIFTAITISAGFKGGEIVPSFFIGATLGGTIAPLVGLSPAVGAAVGMAAMFCGVTNCPLATCFLCAEMFGTDGILIFALSSFASFILSGYTSLYSSQRLVFSKLSEDTAEEDPNGQ